MKQKLFSAALLATLQFAYPVFQPLFAQTDDQKLTATILQKDSLFWISYNTCDTAGNKQFFTTDVEFYHDKGGLTLGAENLSASMKKNLCGTTNFRLRRAAVAGSYNVFPLRNSNGIYGAILSGEHLFYIIEKGKEERLDGQAKFTHVWILQNNTWKMSRILSYDHKPATYINGRKEQSVSDAILNRYAGTYKAPNTGTIQVQNKNGQLVLTIATKEIRLLAETETRFFTKDRDLTFEFVKNDKDGITKMQVREGGNLVEEAVVVK